MMKLDKKIIIKLLKVLPYRKNESAWNRGVRDYAFELLEELPDEYYFACENASEAEQTLKELRKILLNGANSWIEYSEKGCSYIYDYDIAKALCSPSEFIRTNEGANKINNKAAALLPPLHFKNKYMSFYSYVYFAKKPHRGGYFFRCII